MSQRKIRLFNTGVEIYYTGVAGIICIVSYKYIIHILPRKGHRLWGREFDEFHGWYSFGLGPFLLLMWEDI